MVVCCELFGLHAECSPLPLSGWRCRKLSCPVPKCFGDSCCFYFKDSLLLPSGANCKAKLASPDSCFPCLVNCGWVKWPFGFEAPGGLKRLKRNKFYKKSAVVQEYWKTDSQQLLGRKGTLNVWASLKLWEKYGWVLKTVEKMWFIPEKCLFVRNVSVWHYFIGSF